MKKINIQNLVKKLEPHFFGYTANDCSLTNQLGLELRFFTSWNNKTQISGIGENIFTRLVALLQSILRK